MPGFAEEALDVQVKYEFSDTADAISHFDTEQEFADHLEHLRSLAALTGYELEPAKRVVSERLSEFEERGYGEHRPSFYRSGGSREEHFSDIAIQSLFLESDTIKSDPLTCSLIKLIVGCPGGLSSLRDRAGQVRLGHPVSIPDR